MASKKITIENLGKEINKIFDEYVGNIESNLSEITQNV